jgi:hypothetical protein
MTTTDLKQKYKLTSRVPIPAMLDAVEDIADSGIAAGIWSGMHDAAPDIETEAEKKAIDFVQRVDNIRRLQGKIEYTDKFEEADNIIRALLRERWKV